MPAVGQTDVGGYQADLALLAAVSRAKEWPPSWDDLLSPQRAGIRVDEAPWSIGAHIAAGLRHLSNPGWVDWGTGHCDPQRPGRPFFAPPVGSL